MKIKFSLRQIWTALILFAVVVPVTVVMTWYGYQLYQNQLKSALTIERLSNESVRNQIEAEVKRLKTLLQNKTDSISILMKKASNPDILKDINALLRAIINREYAISEIIITSKQVKLLRLSI